ncbi:MAG: DUF72 domain-containing protein [Acidobacteriota bacterium]
MDRHPSPHSDIRIGISGWRYEPWRGVFYPPKMVQRKELAFASRALPSIEINGTFYALQRPASFQQWFDDTPEDFVFSVKAPKLITHTRRLKDVHQPMANFFASGLLALRHKLGPILWQFPPSFRFQPDLFEAFLRDLPHDTDAALKLAEDRDEFMAGREHVEADPKRRVRHAVEIRHPSFADPAFVDMLQHHRVALVVADTAGKWPYLEDVTADFMYLRLHGDEELYASGYTDAALDRWADRITAWSQGQQPADAHLVVARSPAHKAHRDIYCYFDNDIKVRAPFDAAQLLHKLGLPSNLDTDTQAFRVELPP